ncbi:MAG: Fic family protein [Ruminococcus sp.]|nr:Fic family protein [Ruminococcus sp.]
MELYEKALKLWRGYDVKTAADIDTRLENFRMLFAYNSGKIENESVNWHDTREIFENGRVTGFSGDVRALFEQNNQRLCYECLKNGIAAKEPVTVELIKEIHLMLTAGTYDERRFAVNGERPGEFKKHDCSVGINDVGAAPEDVEEELDEMLEVLAESRADPLRQGTFLHGRFEYIHPFADGNGRTGRTLLNYFLMINSHPPLIIYHEDKRLYYEALAAYDKDGELTPLYEFFKYETAKTWAGKSSAVK